MTTTVRKTRQDKGLIKLTRRDIGLLTWIAEQYIVRLDVLQLLMGRPRTTARQWMTRMRDAGWLKFRPIFAGETTYMWLTRSGLEQLGLEFSYWEPSAARVRHAHWVGYTRFVVSRKYPDAEWDCERHIWQRVSAQQQASQKKKQPHIPDAFLYPSAGGTVVIEVELSPKTVKRTVEIMKSYVARPAATEADRWQMWYFVTRASEGTVEEAKSELGSLGRSILLYGLPLEVSR